MDSQPRLYSMDSLKRISERSVPSPTDSLLRTMGHYRPSLVWLFDHIRRGENTTLSKEDLQQLLGSSVDSAELDEAFDNLDIDGDGEISLDDFLAGFARFLKEAPDTPGYDKSRAFSFLPQFLSPRHSRMHEEQYETKAEPDAVNGVSEPPNNFQMSLALLSANNRQSIESLWKSLAVSNPELLGDFEDFVAEISNEVEGAQRALEKQRKATKQEAIELDEEIESRLLDANTKLQIQTALVRQHTKAKVEQHLVMKEMELVSVRQKLEELESEMKEGQKVHMELEQQVVELHKEKEELVVKLEMSETQLRERQSVLEDEVATAHTEEGGVVSKSRGPGAGVRGQGMEVRGQGAEAMREEEGDLLRLKREYEEEIAELKAQLQSYQIESEDEELTGINGSSPDTQGSGSSRKRRPSGCSLMDEIVKTEGAASPILRGEPFISSSFRSSPLSAQRRTSSLPDLARAGLGNGSPSLLLQLPTTIYVPVYVRDPQPTATSLSPDPVAAIPPPAPSDLPHGHKVPLRGVSNGAPLDEALELPAMRRRAMTSPCGGRVSAGVQVQLPAMLEGQREEEEDEVISDEEDSFAEKCQVRYCAAHVSISGRRD